MSLDSILPKLDEEEKKYVEDLIAKQDQVKRSNELEKEKTALQTKHRLLNVEISKVIIEDLRNESLLKIT